jgi:exopolysaccharide biosynthesis polyprenyl glycosylphosphotransferase
MVEPTAKRFPGRGAVSHRPFGLAGGQRGNLLDVSSRVHTGGLPPGHSWSGELSPTLVAAANLVAAVKAGREKWFAAGGRAVLVWLPCYALTGYRFGSSEIALGASLLLAAVWLIGLRSAFAAVHPTLGTPVRCAVGTATGLVGVSAVALWVPGLGMSTSTLVALAASVFVLTTLWEGIIRRIVGNRRVLVVGPPHSADAVAEAVAFDGNARFTVVGAVDDGPDHPFRVGPVAALSRIVHEQRPDLIVLADGEASSRAIDRLLATSSHDFKVVGLAHFFDYAFGRVPIDELTPSWFMSILHVWQRTYTRLAKRTFDVVCASLGLLLAAPLMLVIAGLVSLTRGPVIYRQTRVGEGGRQFRLYKFRTMRQDAERPGHPTFTEVNDPRVTAVGRLLRKTHLDELPQLWVVLKGDMSIVGPRPERPEFIPMLEEAVPFFTRRLLVKPGITGWAQLRRDYASDAEGAKDKLSYDLWYVRHRNVIVDLAICARTFSTLFLRPGR